MEVHLVDGTYELFRAYYGAPEASAPDGREVGATRALARSLWSLVEKEGATHVAVAFDTVIESFRNELFDGYKTGEGIDPLLFGQFELAERVTHALGFTVWPMVEFEADDALAAGAYQYGALPEVERVHICSPDKDLAQCVRGDEVVMVDRRREIVLDEDGVEQKFGVGPASIPDFLGLVGDNADGIPGIPRWGAKSTATVLAVYEHIENIPALAHDWDVKVRGAKTLADTLGRQREDAQLFKKLATLRTDVPLKESVHDLKHEGPRWPELEALAEEIGDTRLVDRLKSS